MGTGMHNGENERDWAWGLELTNALRIRGRDRKRQDGYVDDVTMIHDNLSPQEGQGVPTESHHAHSDDLAIR